MFSKFLGFSSILLVLSIGMIPAFGLTELEGITISNPRLENAFGVEISDNINVNQQIQISADITNNQGKSQSFVYIVQVKDKWGLVVSLGWISGPLAPQQQLSPSLSWTPENEGEFTAEVFVWEDLINYKALSGYTELQINVS